MDKPMETIGIVPMTENLLNHCIYFTMNKEVDDLGLPPELFDVQRPDKLSFNWEVKEKITGYWITVYNEEPDNCFLWLNKNHHSLVLHEIKEMNRRIDNGEAIDGERRKKIKHLIIMGILNNQFTDEELEEAGLIVCDNKRIDGLDGLDDDEISTEYEALKLILDRAFKQASEGKGKERHGNGLAFEGQPMQTISDLLGTNHGLLFQAMKKIQESTRMESDKAVHELLGAINYIAGAILYLEKKDKAE